MDYDVTLSITTYNEEKYLPILLDSIKSQKTNLKMDILIIDDSSTDKTLEIAKSYEGVRIIHNDRKSDVQYMRNTGLKEAFGKVIIFFDADVAISNNFVENMVRPIIEGKTDTTLCKTYAVLEAFYNVLPNNYSKSYVNFIRHCYSKSYVNFIRHCPRFMMKRFPVQFVPWIARWFNMMKNKKGFVNIWNVPNRTHTTGIATKTEIARKTGGWKVRIGDGDDAQYSNDICDASSKVLWIGKCILFVFPTDNGWITDILFKPIKKWYKNKIKKKNDNDYSQSIR